MGIDVGPIQVIDGLIFSIDAANFRSYSGSGLTSNGLVGGIGGSLVNGVGFSSFGGGSFVFDGTNDYIISSANVGILVASPRTICVWVYVSTSQSKNVYGYGQGSGGQIFDIILWNANGYNRVIGHYWGGGNDTIGTLPSRNTVNVPGWNFIVHTYNGTAVSLYTNSIFSNSYNITLNTANSPLTIGRGTYDGYDYFAGSVGALQIYNRLLTEQEILQNYNATKGRYGL